MTTFLSRCINASLACAATCALTLSIASPAFSQSIQWQNQTMAQRPAPAAMTSQQVAQAIQRITRDAVSKRIIVQFSAPMTPLDRQRLANAGVDILAPLGSNAFFATVHRDKLNTASVAAVTRLQLAQPIDPQAKLHNLIQQPQLPDYAIVSEVATADGRSTEPLVALSILFHRDVTREQAALTAQQLGANIVSELQSVNALVIELPRSAIPALAEHDAVQWIELPLPFLTELNAENRAATQANQAQAAPYNLDGTGVKVMVFDSGTALTTHSDFGGRVIAADSTGITNHATHVTGTIAGNGLASMGDYRGMAPNASVVSYGFQWSSGGIFLYTNPGDMEQDYAHAINTHSAVIANNSIGTNTSANGFPCEITGEYGVTDTVIDSIVRGSLGAPIRVVWANGNERGVDRCGTSFNSTAPPACAKNHITVGALNSDDDSVTSFTSWGPAKDGRLKPDISAPGCQIGQNNGVTSTSSSGGYSTLCGTSMASPTVAGLAALILQDFRAQFPDKADMLPSTMKVMLAHTAKDIENVGPDYKTGYGVAQVVDAIEFMRTGSFMEAAISHGETHQILVHIDQPNTPIKITLAWDDAPGTPNSIPALINDLDLLVTGPDGTFYPWTLNPNNPAAPAARNKPDRLNNIEQVLVDTASPGVWSVQVIGYNIPEGPQTYSLAASPNLVTTRFEFPDGVPSIITPGEPNNVIVRIQTQGEEIIDGSASLHTSINGSNFISTPLTYLGNNLYEATLPAVNCAQSLDYYFSVQSTLSGTTSSPSNAPLNTYETEIGQLIHLFSDDFDQHLGWTVGAPDDDAVGGIWERVNPNGSFVGSVPVQPSDAYIGNMCFVTGQHPGGGAGANDVDHGKTTLISPVFDLSDANRAEISYVRWYSNSAGAAPNTDVFEVDISSDGGQTWTNVETVGPAGPGTAGGWFHHTFAVENFIDLTNQVQVRFVASDYDPQSLVDAAVDMFRVRTVECQDLCPADLNGDSVIDVSDMLMVLSAWGQCGQPCLGDLNNDGVIDVSDMLMILSAWGACP